MGANHRLVDDVQQETIHFFAFFARIVGALHINPGNLRLVNLPCREKTLSQR